MVIELDGGHHQNQIDYDSNRTEWLESQGYQVMRFWNSDVQTNLEGIKQIDLYPIEVTPHLGPPPQGGRKAKV